MACLPKLSASGVVTDNYGVLFPAAKIALDEKAYTVIYQPDGSTRLGVSFDNGTCRLATNQEADYFHADLDKDIVQIVVLSRPGYGSDYGRRKVLDILHSPKGSSFNTEVLP